MTYIPKQERVTKERLEVKLEAGLLRRLERYCEFLDSDRDYIVAQALEIAFRKDRGFSAWLSAQGPDSSGVESESGAFETPGAYPATAGKRASHP